jgi:WD40 repeat protein
VSPMGQRVAAGGTGGEVALFDVDGGDRVDLPIGAAWAHQVACSPDGETVAIALDLTGNDPGATGPGTGEVRFVDAETGEPAGEPVDVGEPAIGVGFSPDGRRLVAVAFNNVAHLYDVRTGEELEPAIENVDSPITAFAFSPDGQQLSLGVASGDVRRYDVDTHDPVGDPLDRASGGTFGLAYSPDGRLVAGTSLGFSTTGLWAAESGLPVGDLLIGGEVPYTDRTFLVEHVMGARPAFSPDGQHLAAPGFEDATVIWDLDPVRWAEAACAVVGRDLTEDEWARSLPGRNPEPLCPDAG